MSTAIFEMAFEKKQVMDKSRNLQNQIASHLVKLSMYNKSEYINHWSNEVNAWLDDIQDNWFKGTNRPLNEKDLFNILFLEPLETIEEVQRYMNKAYKNYPNLQIDQPSAAEINKKLAWQLQGICHDIARKQFKDIREYK
jgi:hypothetical protein